MNISIRKTFFISMMFAPILFLLNRVIYSEIGPILVLGACLILCFSNNKLVLTKNFVLYFLMFMVLIFYIIYRVEPIQFDIPELPTISLTNNILYQTSICFLALYIGYSYGYTSRRILEYSEVLALFYLLIFMGLVLFYSFHQRDHIGLWNRCLSKHMIQENQESEDYELSEMQVSYTSQEEPKRECSPRLSPAPIHGLDPVS